MKKNAIQTLEKIFIDHGFSEVKAEIWAQFVRHVFQVYWQATDMLLTTQNWDAFKVKRGALSKPKKSRGKVIQAPIEDALTSEIGYFANQIRIGLPTNHFLRLHEVCFECEALIYSENRAGRHSRTADFRVSAQTGGTQAPGIVIEAKPLLTNGDIANRYMSEEGLGCFFCADSVYTKGPLGAMFAYTVTDTNASLRNDLHLAVTTRLPKPKSVTKARLNSRDWATCSAHTRDHELEPILIVHVERMFPTVPESTM